jgi:hypothetical protein
VIVNAAVSSFTSIFARTMTFPRLNGPATAGFTIDSPNGAPLYGPVMYTLPPFTVYGSPPTPTETTVSPISLSGPHVPAFACSSPHSFTFESVPETPSGIFNWTPCRFCSPSSRLIVITNGVNPPAWMLVVPVVNVGSNGSGSWHGPPFGPLTMSNVEEDSAVGFPDHGVNVPVVV